MINLEGIANKIEPLFDRNISKIEKFENLYLIKRKISTITIAPLFIMLCMWMAYSLYKAIGIGITTSIVLLTLILISVIINILSRKGRDYWSREIIYVLLFLMDIFSNSLFFYSWEQFWELKNLQNIFAFGVMILFEIFNTALVVMMVSQVVADVLKNKFRDIKMMMKLVGGDVIDVELISITKRGDYIVKTRNNPEFRGSEILINRNEVLMIIYNE
ncbi:hypothetical protein [Tumebacillus flagellatus]|uniref:hypothetical protein n=1 Tax=Tumebacillus flagellatus TaxID=1157490 RepID=UPI00126925A2|nr:hypothetical protein [Tumebacillus flagellatus]